MHHYDFPRDIAGFLSMLNDFQVDPAGETIYIAETSPFLQSPALISAGVNFAKFVAKGIDFELAYRRNFANGHRLNFRGI